MKASVLGDFRAQKSAAPLKLIRKLPHPQIFRPFPRSKKRGSIEASVIRDVTVLPVGISALKKARLH